MTSAARNPAWVWWICGASALSSMDRQALANVAPRILAELSIDEPRYGTLELVFSWAFASRSVTSITDSGHLSGRLMAAESRSTRTGRRRRLT